MKLIRMACGALLSTGLASPAFSGGPAFFFRDIIFSPNVVSGVTPDPFATSDGSGFFVHSSQNFGDGTPDVYAPSFAEFSGAPEVEWSTYYSPDPLGPTRQSDTPNNSADDFYISRGVYDDDFSSRSALRANELFSFHAEPPGAAQRRRDVVDAGRFAGFSCPVAPELLGVGPEVDGLPAAFMGRFTVRRGTLLTGRPFFFSVEDSDGNYRSTYLTLNGPTFGDNGAFAFVLRSYLVAQPNISDDGFDTDGMPFGPADVYDVWFTRVAVPGPSTFAAIALCCPLALRRRR